MKSFIVIIGIVLATAQSAFGCQCLPAKAGQEVCASNGQTYGNECFVTCERLDRGNSEACLTEVHKGACKEPKCNCTDTCNFVCGSDGISYGNDCTLKCAQKFNPDLRKVKDGRCGQCNCPLVLAPVCGSDNVSYRNMCALNCNKEKAHDLFKVSDGRCGLA